MESITNPNNSCPDLARLLRGILLFGDVHVELAFESRHVWIMWTRFLIRWIQMKWKKSICTCWNAIGQFPFLVKLHTTNFFSSVFIWALKYHMGTLTCKMSEMSLGTPWCVSAFIHPSWFSSGTRDRCDKRVLSQRSSTCKLVSSHISVQRLLEGILPRINCN